MQVCKPILICRVSRIILRLTCLWPLKGEDFHRGPKSVFFLIVPFAISFIIPIVGINHMIVLWKAGYSLGEDLSMLSSVIAIYLMFIFYGIKQKKIAYLLMDLSYFGKFGEPEGFQSLNKQHDFVAKILILFVTFGVLKQSFFRLMAIPECQQRNLQENCGFVSSSTPIKVTFSGTPILFFSYLFLESSLTHTFVKVPILVSYHVFEIAQHIILRIDHLKSMIINSFENLENIENNLTKCIQYHNKIIDLSERLNDCFSAAMFVHFTLTAVVLACLTNHVVNEFFIGFVFYLIGWCAAFFIACLAGQQLTDASLSIGEIAYNSKWYNAKATHQKYLILLIMRSQRALTITTGSFDYLSYPLFLAVIKSSYSVLTLLN